MKIRGLLQVGAATALAIGTFGAPAHASLTIGDSLDVQYLFPNIGSIQNDTGPFAYTGAGQSVPTQGGTSTVFLYDDYIVFSETPGCGTGCNQTVADYNGPKLINLTNANAFAGWAVLSDTVGITSSTLLPGSVSVNWQGAPVQGEVVIGLRAVPEPASWALMIFGFCAVGYALRRRQQASVAVSFS